MNMTESYEKNGVVYSMKSFLAIGQTWFILFSNASAVTRIEILDITEKTILLKTVDNSFSKPTRYKISDIEFIEMINNGSNS